jgi:hypothetical protein
LLILISVLALVLMTAVKASLLLTKGPNEQT